MVRALLIFGVALLAASMSYAQNSTPTDQTEQVRVLLERVQQLEKARHGVGGAAGTASSGYHFRGE